MLPRGTLTAYERQTYTTAVLCLQYKAAASLRTVAPGARSRFDDFHAVHINQTFIIHNNVCHHTAPTLLSGKLTKQAQFLPWHRYFTWAYEKALRDECGYEGYQPSASSALLSKRSSANLFLRQVLGLA